MDRPQDTPDLAEVLEIKNGWPRLLDAAGLAEVLGVKEGWVSEMITARKIPFTRIGKHVRFAPHHLAAIIAAGEVPVEVPARRAS